MSVMKRNCKCTNKKKMFPFLCVWLPVVLPTQIVCFRFIIYFFNIIRCFVNDETLHQSIGQLRDFGLDNRLSVIIIINKVVIEKSNILVYIHVLTISAIDMWKVSHNNQVN